MQQIKYFDEPSVSCLRQLHELAKLDTVDKTQLIAHTLPANLPRIPQAAPFPAPPTHLFCQCQARGRVQELWGRTVVPVLSEEQERCPEMSPVLLVPLLLLLHHASEALLPTILPLVSRIILKHNEPTVPVPSPSFNSLQSELLLRCKWRSWKVSPGSSPAAAVAT